MARLAFASLAALGLATGCLDDPVRIGNLHDAGGSAGVGGQGNSAGSSPESGGSAGSVAGSAGSGSLGVAGGAGSAGAAGSAGQAGNAGQAGSAGSSGALVPCPLGLASLPLIDLHDQSVTLVRADFNGDGRLDLATLNLATTNGYKSSAGVFLGNGNGTFAPEIDTDLGLWATGLAAGDLNHDGYADIVASVELNGAVPEQVVTLLGKGDGTFAPPLTLTLELDSIAVGAQAVALEDVNGDGKLDLLAVAFNVDAAQSSVHVLLGQGDGSFGGDAGYPIGSFPAGVTAFDLNRDGRKDIITANNGSYVNGDGSLSVLLGASDGSFGPAMNFPAGSLPKSVQIADLNKDGKADVVVGRDPQSRTAGIAVLLGNGDGTLAPELDYATDWGPVPLLEDLNADGVPDILLTGHRFGLSEWVGNGDGTFTAGDAITNADGTVTEWEQAVLGDFNGDGHADVAISTLDDGGGHPNALSLNVWLANAQGTFKTTLESPLADPEDAKNTGFTGACADVNADGRLDLVTVSQISPTRSVSVALGNADGTFTPKGNTLIVNGNSSDNLGPVIADFDGDKLLDIAQLVLHASLGSLDAPTLHTVLLRGNGDGTFAELDDNERTLYATGLVAGDLNRDKKADLVLFSTWPDADGVTTDNGVSILLSNGDGSFATEFNYPLRAHCGGDMGSGVLADLDLDGKLEIVTGCAYPSQLAVLPGNGDGTFGAPTYLDSILPGRILVTDINADGSPDLIVGASSSDGTSPGQVGVQLGNGDGSFASEVDYPIFASTFNLVPALAAADIDGDGVLDLVVTGNDIVSVFRGTRMGGLGARSDFPADGSFAGAADFDGDGRVDVLMTHLLNGAPSASLLRNSLGLCQ